MDTSIIKPSLDKFNAASQPIYDIHNIKWDTIKAVGVSDKGSAGVIFVETLYGSFVIKGSTDPAIEYFCYLFYKSIGIEVPKMVCYEWCDKEYEDIQNNMHKFLCNDIGMNDKVKSRLTTPYFLVMEYLSGNTITYLGTKKAAKYLGADTLNSQMNLIKLGKVVATDTLVNMVDRYPMLWNNEGNAENLMFNLSTKLESTSEELENFNNLEFEIQGTAAIDNRPFMYWHKNKQSEQNYQRYMELFKNHVKVICEAMDEILSGKLDPQNNSEHRISCIQRLTDFIQLNTAYDIGAKGEYYILLGTILGYLNAISFGYEKTKIIYEEILKFAKVDWKDTWKDNLKSINIEMLNDTLTATKQVIGERVEAYQSALMNRCPEQLLKQLDEPVSPQVKKVKVDPDEYDDEELKQRFGIDKSVVEKYKTKSTLFEAASEVNDKENDDYVDVRDQIAAEARAKLIAKKKENLPKKEVKLVQPPLPKLPPGLLDRK